MAKVHVLEQVDPGQFRVVIHYATPPGVNSANKSWVDCAAATSPTTILPEGIGVGVISPAEKASIEAGETIEIVRTIPAESGSNLLNTVNDIVDTLIINDKTVAAFRYKYFGYEIAS